MPPGHLFISFGEMPIQVFCPFLFLSKVAFLLLSFKNSFYTLDTSPVLDIRFSNPFSCSLGCVFTILIGSFEAQEFLNFDDVQSITFLLLVLRDILFFSKENRVPFAVLSQWHYLL